MSNQESRAPHQNRLDRFSGSVFAGLAEMYLHKVHYDGLDNVHYADQMLKNGNSALFVSDHPSTLSTMWTSNVVTMLSNRQATGILLKDAFAPESKKQIGYVIRQIIAHHNAEPLFVKTERYESDEDARAQYNQAAINRGNEILGTEGGCLFLFAQGTRDKKMLQAKSGLANFAALAGFVVPMTTITESKHPTVVVHPPIPGKAGTKWCVENFGEETGPRVFSDLVMSIVATAQPNIEKKGVYIEASKALEVYMQTHEVDGVSTDERTQRVLSAYIAWEQNKFDQ